MDGSSGSAVFPGDLTKTHTALSILADRFAIEIESRPSDVPAFKTSAPHAGADSLDDQIAFKFRDRSDDHNDGAAQRAARIDLFAEADELDVEPVELVEHFEEAEQPIATENRRLTRTTKPTISLFFYLSGANKCTLSRVIPNETG